MPRRALSPCATPGCASLVERGYCASHRQERERQRGTRHERGYDHQHEQWRAAVLARDPICTYCEKAPSTEADHIVPLRIAPHRRLDVTNGRGACKPCHSRHGTKATGEPKRQWGHRIARSHPHPDPLGFA